MLSLYNLAAGPTDVISLYSSVVKKSADLLAPINEASALTRGLPA